MTRSRLPALATAALLAAATSALVPGAAAAQTFPSDDAVIRQIWELGMGAASQVEPLAQVLLDSIGPRLSGSPGQQEANDWLAGVYESWGVGVEQEPYGTWRGWDRGWTHIDLVEPRIRTLNGTMMAWSPGTEGPLEGPIVALPTFTSPADLASWAEGIEGAFVALNASEPTCRAPESWETYGTPESWERMQALRQANQAAWGASVRAAGGQGAVVQAIEAAGAAGVLTTRWSAGWGANKIFSAPTSEIPSVHLSCEDYGLVHRLAANGQGPRLRLDARAEFLGEVPVYNVIGTLPGTELPDEYVLLTAHLDSWDGASGATDNGSGTVMMMEAMRILKEVYPNPRRTIIAAHWGGEEQGLIGSMAYAEDHPEVVDGLQAAFNQDNGTWRIDFIRMQGYLGAGENFGRWFSEIPREITQHIELDVPGVPETGGSDHMSFICRGAAGFRLQSNYPDYRQYTWHTDIDTYDKLVFDDLRNNATLAAMLAYLASEDDDRVGVEQRELDGRTWPGCRPAQRSSGG
ncbi:MAG: M20/M25/M40 family metallo-hydrolase [Gemmatimonadetes bacterium]|nr:M20/M25/M40 family metallo-hydrolase [Gemmatimonadota bacterium]